MTTETTETEEATPLAFCQKALTEMTDLVDWSRHCGEEGAHVAADRLLWRIIRVLAKAHGDEVGQLCDAIIEQFQEMEIWYS